VTLEKTNNEFISRAIEQFAREEGGRILAALIGMLRDFQLAEDSYHDALESALLHWNRNGLPSSPPAWIMQTAKRKAIDRFRKVANFQAKSDELARLIEMENQSPENEEIEPIADDRLKLIFTCCHPALERKTSVALTLRSVCGLKTEEIAAAFLDSHDAMAQRLVRARQKIAASGIAYEVPGPEGWPDRLESVLAVIYLMFNQGYGSSGPDHIRIDLCEEAIRLARLLSSLCPREAEVEGLLALMLLHHARSGARIGPDGAILSLEMQERHRWNRAMIGEGTALLERALRRGRPGLYQLQAAIIAIHAEAKSFADTDWREIILIYETLRIIKDNPVFELNQIVAWSYVEGPARALTALEGLSGVLASYQPFHAVRAHLLARAGNVAEATEAYGQAILLSGSEAEKKFLVKKRRDLGLTGAKA
jgi:RNA polymerase sigma-70 factor (ECF subfamily)